MEISGDNKLGNPFVTEDVTYYEGEVARGQQEERIGKCVQVCLKGDGSSWLYEGYNIDGVREGKGRLILSSGNVY